jgi:hypothetical protein
LPIWVAWKTSGNQKPPDDQALSGNPVRPGRCRFPDVELTPEDVDRYRALRNGQKELAAVIKLSKKRSGGGEDFDLED